MGAEWYCQIMGDVFGPVPPSELKRLAQATRITPDTLVRKGADGDWLLAERVQGLFGQPSDVRAQPTHPPTASKSLVPEIVEEPIAVEIVEEPVTAEIVEDKVLIACDGRLVTDSDGDQPAARQSAGVMKVSAAIRKASGGFLRFLKAVPSDKAPSASDSWRQALGYHPRAQATRLLLQGLRRENRPQEDLVHRRALLQRDSSNVFM